MAPDRPRDFSRDDMASALVAARGTMEAREYHPVKALASDDRAATLEQRFGGRGCGA